MPLADTLRPTNLADYVGQLHLVGVGKPLYQAIKLGTAHSMIFWGPPGTGKTTLAQILAKELNLSFHHLSAVAAGKKDVRAIIESVVENRTNLLNANAPQTSGAVLFLDEIHRFNKAQQDFLLPYVEDGTITLIGATTENPSFEVIPALLSRCQVFVLEPLNETSLASIIQSGMQALTGRKKKQNIKPKALEFLVNFANGDARLALNLLEATYTLYKEVSLETLKVTLQSKHLRYDVLGEEHYNTISAFIKSMRASNVDAALYYLARMVDAGEDPLFIARRMVIFASEDIGMAAPTALVVANAVFRACETVGYPECQENLAAGVAYLATCKKDRSAYDAYMAALADVKLHGNLPIPLNLRNAPTKLMKELGYGSGYEQYSKESLLPDKLKSKKYFER
jgi:putative ATPase